MKNAARPRLGIPRVSVPRPTTGFSAGRTVEFALILTLTAALVIGAAAAFSASTNRRLLAAAADVRGDSMAKSQPETSPIVSPLSPRRARAKR